MWNIISLSLFEHFKAWLAQLDHWVIIYARSKKLDLCTDIRCEAVWVWMYIRHQAYKKNKRSAWLAPQLFYLTKFGFSVSLIFFVPFGALFCLGFFRMTFAFSFFYSIPLLLSGLFIVFGFHYRKFFSSLDLARWQQSLLCFLLGDIWHHESCPFYKSDAIGA
jgi:hypothetical protein